MSEDKTIMVDGDVINNLFKVQKKIPACLVQWSGSQRNKRYFLDRAVMTIGRSGDVEIIVNEQSVSRQHARCYVADDCVELEDLGSSNGSFIENERLTGRIKLENGANIRLGNVVFKFYSANSHDSAVVDEMYRQAIIDAGTDTFNKGYLLETLDQEFKFARASLRDLSLIYFDLDFFKKVNDTYGHSAGDFILRETSDKIKGILRKDDIFCRFGGEEFVILLPNTNAREAYDLAERIRIAIEVHPFEFEGKTIKQTISLGVSQLNRTMDDPQQLMNDADKKLYHSKQNGRNQVTI